MISFTHKDREQLPIRQRYLHHVVLAIILIVLLIISSGMLGLIQHAAPGRLVVFAVDRYGHPVPGVQVITVPQYIDPFPERRVLLPADFLTDVQGRWYNINPLHYGTYAVVIGPADMPLVPSQEVYILPFKTTTITIHLE
jgi:hypothetical protein